MIVEIHFGFLCVWFGDDLTAPAWPFPTLFDRTFERDFVVCGPKIFQDTNLLDLIENNGDLIHFRTVHEWITAKIWDHEYTDHVFRLKMAGTDPIRPQRNQPGQAANCPPPTENLIQPGTGFSRSRFRRRPHRNKRRFEGTSDSCLYTAGHQQSEAAHGGQRRRSALDSSAVQANPRGLPSTTLFPGESPKPVSTTPTATTEYGAHKRALKNPRPAQGRRRHHQYSQVDEPILPQRLRPLCSRGVRCPAIQLVALSGVEIGHQTRRNTTLRS